MADAVFVTLLRNYATTNVCAGYFINPPTIGLFLKKTNPYLTMPQQWPLEAHSCLCRK